MNDNKRKIPITRLNRFYSEEDFKLEIAMGREWLEGDVNIMVILYRIDKSKTLTDSLYGEATTNEMRFHTPKELLVYPTAFGSPENKTYTKGSLQYHEHGNFIFSIYNEQLEEKGIDISYGDYIGYPENEHSIKYFQVTNDGRVNSDHPHTLKGFKSVSRTITAVPVNEDEFKAI